MIHRRKSTHSTGYLNDDGMIRRHRYFEFDVNNTQIISGLFSTLSGQVISVDWGDGSRSSYSGTAQAWSHDYGSVGNRTVRIFGSVALISFKMDQSGADISCDLADLPAAVAHFECYGDNTITGDIADLPDGLTYFSCFGDNTIIGDLADLPSGFTFFACGNSNTISGDIANLPSGLTHFECWGSNTISGDLADLPSGLTYFGCWGSNTIAGDLADLPDGITRFYCRGSNVVAGYGGKTWTTKPSIFEFVPVSPGGLSQAEVDQLLIDLDDDLTWASGDAITLTGTNAARSAASDAAVANMVAEGATITTN